MIYLDDFIEDDYMDVIIVLMGLESQGIVSLIFYDDAYIRKDFTKVDWEDLAKNKFIHHIELNKAKPAYWSFAINNSSFEIREKRTFEMEYFKWDGDVYVTMPDRKILAKRFGSGRGYYRDIYAYCYEKSNQEITMDELKKEDLLCYVENDKLYDIIEKALSTFTRKSVGYFYPINEVERTMCVPHYETYDNVNFELKSQPSLKRRFYDEDDGTDKDY